MTTPIIMLLISIFFSTIVNVALYQNLCAHRSYSERLQQRLIRLSRNRC